MLAHLGYSKKLGPVVMGLGPTDPLGRLQLAGPRLKNLFDAEQKRLIIEGEATARRLISENRDFFDALVEALLEKHRVEGSELQELLAATLKKRETASGSAAA